MSLHYSIKNIIKFVLFFLTIEVHASGTYNISNELFYKIALFDNTTTNRCSQTNKIHYVHIINAWILGEWEAKQCLMHRDEFKI